MHYTNVDLSVSLHRDFCQQSKTLPFLLMFNLVFLLHCFVFVSISLRDFNFSTAMIMMMMMVVMVMMVMMVVMTMNCPPPIVSGVHCFIGCRRCDGGVSFLLDFSLLSLYVQIG